MHRIMGGKILLVIAGALLHCSLADQGDIIYTAVTPSKVSSESKLPIYTTLHSGTKFPVEFTFSIQDAKNGSLVTQATESFTSVGEKEVVLQLPRLLDDYYNLTVSVQVLDGDKKLVQKDSVVLGKAKKARAILIQTDKPVYKPGETVKYRVFLLSRGLKPLKTSRSVSLKIVDSSSIVVKVYPKSAPITIDNEKGFHSGQFQLSTEPNLGQWRIEVEDLEETGERDTLYFSVDQYVLPKYKVDIVASPSFVTYNDSKTIISLTTTYTHGKPVRADCSLEVKEPYSYYTRKDKVNKLELADDTSEEGKINFEVDLKKDFALLPEEINRWGKTYRIEASCKDKASGNVRNATSSITVYQYPFKIEMTDRPANIKPGFPVNFTLKFSTQDGVPISDGNKEAVKIEHGFDFTAEGGVRFSDIPKNGLLTLTFVAPTNPKICYEAVDVTYKGFKENFWLPSKQVSDSRSYMQVQLLTPKNEIKEGSKVMINVKSSYPMDNLNVLVIARGIVQTHEIVQVKSRSEGPFVDNDIEVKLPVQAYPKAAVLIYTIFSNGELIAESVKLDVLPEEGKEVILKVNPERQEPGENVTINVKGKDGKSYFGLRAVDQSVLLLKKDNDLSEDRLKQVADSFRARSNYYGGSEIFQVFNDNGIALLTNSKVQKGNADLPGIYYRPGVPMAQKVALPEPAYDTESAPLSMTNRLHARPVAAFGSGSAAGSAPPAPPAIRTRTEFPETWIFEEIKSDKGELNVVKTVPDTITSWFISAFQLGPEVELSLTKEPEKLTVFRPFFLSLNLPYSIVMGEELGLRVLVHNYLDEEMSATVSLENVHDYKILGEGQTSHQVKVKGGSISTVVFPVVATKHGILEFEVKGVADRAGDALKTFIHVNPPGIKHTQNTGVFIDLIKTDKFEKSDLTAVFPANRVKSADSVKVTVIGDILGGTIDNLGSLVRIPSGCGEQNMVNFVPNIVVLDYLNITGQTTDYIERRAVNYLEKGYQQQLKFIRSDGSFSAFGNSDKVGSTWLTAFVTRSFLQARKYIDVDPSLITRSVRFLLRQQNDNGSFAESGFVYDKSLMGGVNGDTALTSYVLLALKEADNAKTDIPALKDIFNGTQINDGVQFVLKHDTGKLEKDAYTLSIVSYMLQKLENSNAKKYFELLKKLQKEKEEDGTVHWEQVQPRQKYEGLPNKTIGILRTYPVEKTRPANVEITSYALLTHLLHKDINDAVKVGKWLLQKRNAYGGFVSTQDTVVGLQALGKFAEEIATTKSTSEITVSSGPDAKHTFKVDHSNRIASQEFILPLGKSDSEERKISLSATGTGSALAQLTWSYYIEAATEKAFNLKAEVTEKDKGRSLNMRICAEYKSEIQDSSNMALLTANAPSGYTFDPEELENLHRTGEFKRYELENKDNRVTLYFTELERNKEKCISLQAYRVYMVAKHQPGEVAVFDYYDNTQKGEILYQVPPVSLCDICKVEGDCSEDLLKQCKN